MAKWRNVGVLSLALVWIARGSVSQELDTRVEQLHTEARAAEREGRLDAAIQKYRAILQLSPNLAPACNNLGKLYFLQARYQEATKALRRALALDPKLATAHALLGISLYQLNDLKDASRELREALKLDPSDRRVKFYLAQCLSELGDRETAAHTLEQLQREDPQNADVLYSLAYAYLELASATLGKLRSLQPDSYLIDLFLGKTAEGKEQYAEAIGHYKNAIAKAPKVQGLHSALAHVLWSGGRLQEAIQEYRLELEVNPENYLASWGVAELLVQENPHEAFRYATRALELKPDLAPAFLTRGRALLALKMSQEAVADLKKSAALDPDEEKVHFQLSRAYRQLGLTRAADSELAIFERLKKAPHQNEGTSPPP
jgi:tetratricopeptide (TPR) repeat protein